MRVIMTICTFFDVDLLRRKRQPSLAKPLHVLLRNFPTARFAYKNLHSARCSTLAYVVNVEDSGIMQHLASVAGLAGRASFVLVLD